MKWACLEKFFFLCKCYPQTSFYCTKTFINVWAVIFYYCPLSLWLGWSQGKFGPLMEAATVHSHKRMKKKNNVFINIYIEILWDLKRCCEGSQKSARQSESGVKNVFESLIRKKKQDKVFIHEWVSVVTFWVVLKTNDKCQDFALHNIVCILWCHSRSFHNLNQAGVRYLLVSRSVAKPVTMDYLFNVKRVLRIFL